MTRGQEVGPGAGRTWAAGLLGPRWPLRPLLHTAARRLLGLPGSHAGHRHEWDGLALLRQGEAGLPQERSWASVPRAGRHQALVTGREAVTN